MDAKIEKSLIKAAQRGDNSALAQLLQQHYHFLRSYLIKITMNKQLAEDLTQETMLRTIQKIQLYQHKAKFSSWLIQIGTNLYLDDLRRKKTETKWQLQEQARQSLKWQLQSREMEWSDTLDALSHISEAGRIAIVLKHYYGYSYDEIGQLLAIPSGTVKSRVSNGLKELRKELLQNEEA